MVKKKGRTERQPVRAQPRQLLAGLEEATALMDRKRWNQAHDLLADLDRRYPNQPNVVALLMDVAFEQKDMQAYQRAAERLLRLTPDDPDVTLALAGAYLTNARPALALRTFRRFLARWPDHEHAAEARTGAAGVETMLLTALPELGLAGAEGLDLAAQHEEIQVLSGQGQWAQARKLAEQVLQRKPDFIPVLNNVSQVYFAEGQVDRAIAAAERVLALDPENYHALSNLTRYLCLSGRLDEARQAAERLKAIDLNRVDAAVKQAEALSFLGDDQGVLDARSRAAGAEDRGEPYAAALLYHLAGVAALRLGREDEARRHWRQALKLAPWLDLAQANLDDLKKPVGERHAPWPFSFAEWMPRTVIEELLNQVQVTSKRVDEQATARATRRFLQKHPAITALVPMLLDRGDPAAREFALHTALMVEMPELQAVLHDFALSQRGPDKMRSEAAQAAQQAGLLPTGMVRLWLQGAWHDVMVLGFEVTDEPDLKSHQPQVTQWQQEATLALRQGDAGRAEGLLKQALEREPDAPDLLNNLAFAYSLQGRNKDAEALVRQIHERDPDYFFGRTNMALVHIRNRRLDEAQALLEPLLAHKRIHFSELSALMNAEIELFVAKNNLEAARSWLEMWAQTDPDNPAVGVWRRRLGKPGLRQRLLGRRG